MEIDNISPVYMPPLIKLRSFFNLNENFHSPLRLGTWNVLSQSLLVWLLYCDVYLFMDTLCKGLKGNCILVAIAWKLNKGLLCYLLAFILGMHSFLYILSIQCQSILGYSSPSTCGFFPPSTTYKTDCSAPIMCYCAHWKPTTHHAENKKPVKPCILLHHP